MRVRLAAIAVGSTSDTRLAGSSMGHDRGLPPRHGGRRATWVAGAVIVGAAFMYVGLTCWALLDARSAMLRGVNYLHQAQAESRLYTKGTPRPSTYGMLRQQVDRAARDFHTAHDRLEPFAPLLKSLGWVPRYGGEIAASPALTQTADEIGQGLKPLLHGVEPLALDVRNGKSVKFSALLRQIGARRKYFRRACSAFNAALTDRATISPATQGSLSASLHTFDRLVPGLDVACRALVLLPGLLGYPSSRTYLLAYQNPAELRATGGFIGSAGLLTFKRGRITQRFHGTGFREENFTIPSPEPVQYYNFEPFWLFRDSNWSPNFPTSAALERYFLHLDLHATAAGTINITPAVATDVFSVVGPEYIPEYHTLVSSANVAALANYYANLSNTPGPYGSTAGSGDIGAKAFIGIVATRLFARLERLPAATWFKLAENLTTAVRTRDLLLNFTDSADQRLARRLGASGEINRTSGDYLYVVDTNLSYNKINPFIRESVRYHVSVRTDRWLESNLTLHFKNSTPTSMAIHGIGPGAGTLGGPIDYADFVRVYVPAGAQLTAEEGWTQAWTPGPAYDKTMFCGYLLVPHNRSATVRLQYSTPPNVFTLSGGARYQLVVQHQPGSHPTSWYVTVTDGGREIRRHDRRPQSDWSISVPVEQRPFQPLSLSPQPATVVAPGHWIEPHAFLAAPAGR